MTKRVLTKSSKKLFGRLRAGLLVPGRYVFLTLTSSLESPPDIVHSWGLLQKRMKRVQPFERVVARTREGRGSGVLHIVIRADKYFDIVWLRAQWTEIHKARQMNIQEIQSSDRLARYVADQRHKRYNRITAEFAWQDDLVSWKASNGWLPKGFHKGFPTLWASIKGLESQERDERVKAYVLALSTQQHTLGAGPVRLDPVAVAKKHMEVKNLTSIKYSATTKNQTKLKGVC